MGSTLRFSLESTGHSRAVHRDLGGECGSNVQPGSAPSVTVPEALPSQDMVLGL